LPVNVIYLPKKKQMKKLNINVFAMAIGLAFSVGAMAQAMTQEQYKSGKNVIAAEYKIAKGACAPLSGNASDICKAEASGKAKVETAELNAKYLPSENASYKVRVARAEADYLVTKQKCDDQAGNVKDVCVKEAKATVVAAKANAKAHKKIAAAHVSADEKSVKAQIVAADEFSNAQSRASQQSADARNDAASEKRVADYALAKEKCNALAGDAKGNCIKDATARFGKS